MSAPAATHPSRAQGTARAPVLPGAVLGVMGGGQLGRMFVHAAQSMGYATAVLDPDPASPAGLVSQHHIRTAYTDAQGLAELARLSAAVTTEFENVPAQALADLARTLPVSPGAPAVAIAQDRVAEKRHFTQCAAGTPGHAGTGIGPAPYAVIESAADLRADGVAGLLPGILKTARMGYDGKGQVRVADAAALATAWQELQRAPCVLERMLPLAAECSVIVARAPCGATVHFPAQRNLHRDGILAVTEVFDGNLHPALGARAVEAARAIARVLDYVGVLCVEFFVLADGSLVVNEMAPRPHNSGHYTIDACDQSQFDLQVRCMTGLPIVQPRQHSAAVMLNLLGDLWFAPRGRERVPDWAQVLALPGAHLHLYGKSEPRRGRKMGHLTLTAPSASLARERALQACTALGLPPF